MICHHLKHRPDTYQTSHQEQAEALRAYQQPHRHLVTLLSVFRLLLSALNPPLISEGAENLEKLEESEIGRCHTELLQA